MPLQNRIDHEHDEDEDQHVAHHSTPLPRSSWAFGWGMYEAWWTAAKGFLAKANPQQPDLPRVGKYYADYSELTPEEIAQPDAKLDDLFRRSKPVSR
jgi:hypothetical protein